MCIRDSAGPLVDVRHGWDLAGAAGQRAWVEVIKQAEPLLVMVGFPCATYCAFNVRLNYRGREHLLLERQQATKPMLHLMVATFLEQDKHGRHFLLENPASSELWIQPELEPLLRLPTARSGVGHLCAGLL